MMDDVLLLLLGFITALMGWLAFRARERYLNLEAGSPFRDSVLLSMLPILNDPRATSEAYAAAEFMLAAVYDARLLRRAMKIAINDGHHHYAGLSKGYNAAGFTKERFGCHLKAIKDGVRNLAVLALLSDEFTGKAIRQFLDGDRSHPYKWEISQVDKGHAINKTDGAGPVSPDTVQREIASQIRVALFHLPRGRQVNIAVSESLLEKVGAQVADRSGHGTNLGTSAQLG